MYDCLTDLIKMRGVCGTESSTDNTLYLDDVPGISLRKAVLVNDEHLKAGDFISQVIRQGVGTTVQEFLAKVSNIYTFEQVLQTAHLGRKPSKYDNSLTGKIYLEIFKNDDDPFVVPYISDIRFYSDMDKDTKLYIEDGCGTTELDICLKCGENIIAIHREINGCSLKISMDWDDRGIASEYGCKGSCGCTVSNCQICSPNCFYVKAWTDETGVITDYSDLLGFTVKGMCKCSIEELVCRYAHQLAYAALYKCAIVYFNFMLNSTNINYFVTNSADTIDRNLLALEGGVNRFTGMTVEGQFPAAMKLAIDGIRNSMARLDTKCISCGRDSIKVVKNIP